MKDRLFVLTVCFSFCIFVFGIVFKLPIYAEGKIQKNVQEKELIENTEMRAVWFSFLDWQNYLQGKSEAEFRTEFDTICDNVIAHRYNTIVIHVRSHNDAVYPSKIYPWSTMMLNGDPGYDPLKIMTEIAHSKNLKIHAWINPYGYRNGEYAGNPELITADNIVAGIQEILDQYDVDGIHFDDYFPPLGANVHNDLIRRAYQIVHQKRKIFGISPQGNVENNMNNGADVTTWLQTTGYIDYICPQIYWSDQYGKNADITMFSNRLTQWTKLNKISIPMYIGLAGYRAGEEIATDPGWKMKNTNLVEQLKLSRDAGWDGFILYNYSSIFKENTQEEMKNFEEVK